MGIWDFLKEGAQIHHAGMMSASPKYGQAASRRQSMRESQAREKHYGQRPVGEQVTRENVANRISRLQTIRKSILDNAPDTENLTAEEQRFLNIIDMGLADLQKQYAGQMGMGITKKTTPARTEVRDWWFDKEIPEKTEYNIGPLGGQELDEQTATAILKEAGGDKEKARRIARQRGYNF